MLESTMHQSGDSTYDVRAKSLGASNLELGKKLSSAFNRKEGYFHVCTEIPCPVDGDYVYHVSSLTRFADGGNAGWTRDYVTASMRQQIKKWLQHEEGVEEEVVTEEPPGVPPGIEASEGWEMPALPKEDKGNAGKRKARAPAALSGPKTSAKRSQKPGEKGVSREKATKAGGEVREDQRAALRERLSNARARLVKGGVGERSQGERKKWRPSEEIVVESSSPEPSPSLADEPLGTGNELPAPPALYALPWEVPEEEGKKKRKAPGQGPDKKSKKIKKKEKRKVTPADKGGTKDGTTNNLQGQLALRAAQAVQEREKEKVRKSSSSKRKPVTQLVQMLGKALSGKNIAKKKRKKKKKEKSKKVKKERGGLDPSESPSSSGEGSSSDSYETDEEIDKWEEDSGSSRSRKLEPPLRRKSLEKPGSVLKMLVDHARAQLDQTGKVSLAKGEELDPTKGIRIGSYFAIVIKPQVGAMTTQMRELHHLANAIDLLRAGELDSLGDLLASRFIAIHQAVIDGHWQPARHLEMNPLENVSAAGPAVVLQARTTLVWQRRWSEEMEEVPGVPLARPEAEEEKERGTVPASGTRTTKERAGKETKEEEKGRVQGSISPTTMPKETPSPKRRKRSQRNNHRSRTWKPWGGEGEW